MRVTRASRWIGVTATSARMVEQLGLATRQPSPHARAARHGSSASGFTSGTTSGVDGSIRNALELSTTTAPAATAAGATAIANSLLTARRTTSHPAKVSAPIADDSGKASIVHDRPPHSTGCPALRPLAIGRNVPTGNDRSASTASISLPTAPVAPTTATVRGFESVSARCAMVDRSSYRDVALPFPYGSVRTRKNRPMAASIGAAPSRSTT